MCIHFLKQILGKNRQLMRQSDNQEPRLNYAQINRISTISIKMLSKLSLIPNVFCKTNWPTK